MTLAELWDICIKFMWDEEYILGLDQFLKFRKIKTILDCAGGTGFPAITLKKRGWDITYSDSSQQMFDFFEKELQNENLQIHHHLINWMELSDKFSQKFDAVLCRGNSLVYVDSWDDNKIQQITRENIKKSLQEFLNILTPNGLLYVDIINKKEFDSPLYPIVEEFGEKIVDGKKIKLTWELTHDYEKRKRTWRSILLIDGIRHEFSYFSYLLRHE
ncbi:MAG: hypothetical protein A3D52_01910 [Candidatus Taylorbacteria bacterium RIFCSPHIGHO2_02_FULL_44_36]|uniref:Methyltransferase domain-containing protein n=1 Tax=Candidatus Taylorbacteria bacterium RIFCSPLOWO2_12_FULL_44_15c TaxID=1802333 RepID=A0A1G2P6H1_9BACT|nr:MAG: hypothetical protein A3D52_01910 [Candidatus Taylorbacteria bacterium RIFCSPHIGHO2_02_FULL_44_36]OHA39124.1 MAG: hypothetical protein A3I97_01555 [Candidatus Taylorbacteria bacterium RIFCSPLOWO2_02_FULL_44_35]OHA43937.1 MAG: hypothetical protein A3G03_03480 [Candidatus Taylorbacteria bacterium RIFCSPLOWO2_12_FULL_44_15c]